MGNDIYGGVSVGYLGTGSFTQSAGTANVSDLSVAYNAGSTGRYSLTGPGFVTSTLEDIGDSGTGSFTQSAGTNNTSIFFLGEGPGASGSYSLNGPEPPQRLERRLYRLLRHRQLHAVGGNEQLGQP